MFSLAISSIWVCWRRVSPLTVAATSGSAAASEWRKKPESLAGVRGRTEEIARGAPLAEKNRVDGQSGLDIYHMSVADVSRILGIASRLIKCRARPTRKRVRQKLSNETVHPLFRNSHRAPLASAAARIAAGVWQVVRRSRC